MKNKKIPVVVCAVVNDVLRGSHATLNALFRNASAPGDPPDLSHASKWKTWLMRANDDPDTDAHQVLGRVLEEFMEIEPAGDEDYINSWREDKRRVQETLKKYGLRYHTGGRIARTVGGLATESMEQALKERDFEPLEIEFRRALGTVEQDPGSAITAACSLLEALFQAYLEVNDIPLPKKKTVKPLWSAVQKDLGLEPKDQHDLDIQRILSGMISVVDGIGALRTHAGSAHGGGKFRYRTQARHAKLVVNSAHSLAVFLIETWEDRDKRSR